MTITADPTLFDLEVRPMIHPNDTARARKSDPTTSHQAADSNNVQHSVDYVHSLLAHYGPLADHELVQRADHESDLCGDNVVTYSPSRLRTARNTLTQAGVVEFAGIYRLTATNRRAQVWQVSA